ncbi:glycosyltransferase 87 family protein [Frigidibacter sp. SD6-1]|uniref:glycosyltransferase 87 family protein n=1 Tax=Frigidibacter sp. SD6-1 TaxID=3032581 RepID=UPI0024DF4146|nr:glycosyltransferase 87 family protein [Frigidibacter sp. SD6-1]
MTVWQFGGGASADFRAGWMAGRAFAEGRYDLIYPPHNGVYTMQPPIEWVAELKAEGYKGLVYPFVYPPLWAWVAAQFAKISDIGTLIRIASALNALMMVGTLALAHRLAAPRMSQTRFMLVGLGFFLVSASGIIALYENQPQILVAFLTLLAIERTEHGNGKLGGAALALAASLKLFPAVIALIWIATGRRSAAVSFGLVGTALGLASILCAGWPLHREFLSVLGDISATSMMTRLNFSLESAAAILFFSDQLQVITAASTLADPAAVGRFSVLSEPPMFHFCSNLMQVAGIITVLFLFRRAERTGSRDYIRASLWPSALTLLALTGPLAWSYYFIAPLAFVPSLIERAGRWIGTGALVLSALLTSPFALSWIPFGATTLAKQGAICQLLGTAAFSLLAVLFLIGGTRTTSMWRRDQANGS